MIRVLRGECCDDVVSDQKKERDKDVVSVGYDGVVFLSVHVAMQACIYYVESQATTNCCSHSCNCSQDHLTGLAVKLIALERLLKQGEEVEAIQVENVASATTTKGQGCIDPVILVTAPSLDSQEERKDLSNPSTVGEDEVFMAPGKVPFPGSGGKLFHVRTVVALTLVVFCQLMMLMRHDHRVAPCPALWRTWPTLLEASSRMSLHLLMTTRRMMRASSLPP